MNQIEVRRRHATSGLTIRGAKLFFKKVHTLRGWDRREARLRLFGNPKHITPKFASCATSITWRATRPWARQSGARSSAIVDICICRETGERGANPTLSKRGKMRIECCSSARREPDFSAPPEPPKQPISVTQDFRHPRSEADSLGAAGRSLERKSSFLAHLPPRSRQALAVQKERRGVREAWPFGPRAGRP